MQGVRKGKSAVMTFMKGGESEKLAECFKYIFIEFNDQNNSSRLKLSSCINKELLFPHIHSEVSVSGNTKLELFYNLKIAFIVIEMIEAGINYK